MNKLVSIIVVNYNGRKYLEKCLPSVYGQDYKNIEVILVDNASKDGSVEYVKEKFPKVKIIINKENLGFAEANNQGYKVSEGDFILFLNNDTVVTKNFLSELLNGFKDPKVGALQSKILLLENKDTLDVAGSFLTKTGFLYHLAHKHKDDKRLDKISDIFSAKGACMIFRKNVLEKVKVQGEIFDSRYFAYFEESDLCHRTWLAGYEVKYYPTSVIYHKMGATSNKMNNSFIQFHSFKNRINAYLKNLELRSLIVVLPIHLLIVYALIIVSLLQLKFSLFAAINKAVFWNILNLKNTFEKRRIVQHNIRKVSDRFISQRISKSPELNYYLYLFRGLNNYNYKELRNMRVLQVTPHFRPNVGGVETHLQDLVNGLTALGHDVFILTYRPLMTRTDWKVWEKGDNFTVLRIPWIRGLFYKLVNSPFWELAYLLPGLFFVTPIAILLTKRDVVHAHGMVAGFAGVFWGKLLRRRVVISTHSIYHFPPNGYFRAVSKLIFSYSDCVLTLSEQSKKEVISLGIDKEKVKVFTYWIDLDNFIPVKKSKEKLKWKNNFVVLFVGRLVEEKGILVALEASQNWNKNIVFVVVGDGPLKAKIEEASERNPNVKYFGRISQKKLPLYYSAADITLVPSIHEEGFGRVILESLACGTPVIASNRGAIPEAMDEDLGSLITLTKTNLINEVNYYYKNKSALNKKAKRARRYSETKYSAKNIETILVSYGQ